MKLSLHRSSAEPDWARVPAPERNGWQNIAAQTRGIVTPANVITLVGFLLALWGIGMMLMNHFWWAIILLAIGRLLDIVDGVVAERTGTKSALGEAMDASVDKIIIILTVVALFITNAAVLWVLVVFVVPHVIAAGLGVFSRLAHIELHPSRLGKTTTLLAWIAIPVVLIINALSIQLPNGFVILSDVFLLVAAGFGFVTAYDYAPKRENPSA